MNIFSDKPSHSLRWCDKSAQLGLNMAFQNSWDELRFRQSFHLFDHLETTVSCWDH